MKVHQNITPKDLARESRAYFARHYLGLDYATHQYKWLEENLFNHTQELLLSPRDHGKTTTIPRVGIEQDTLFNQNHNVLLLSKTYSQSKKTLDLIYKDLSNNDLIQEDFNEELSDLHKVGNQVFYNMPNDNSQRDGTIEATGILGDITGAHFTHIIMDDIFDDANCRTPQSRKQIMDQINGTILPLLEPGGCLTGIGTRKHYDDGYQDMIDNPAWYVSSEKAIIEYPESFDYVYDKTGTIVDVTNITGDYKVLWPEKWDIKKLLLKSAQMGNLIFRREYQNEVNQLKGKIFKNEWLHHYSLNNDDCLPSLPPLESMDIYQGVDLAISQSEGADYFVITTVGVTHKPYRRWVIDWYRKRIDFPNQVKVVASNFVRPLNNIGIDKWNVLRIGLESNAYQVALSQQIISEWGLPVKPINSTGNKSVRITAGSVDYENGVWMIPLDHPEYDNFLNEYAEFDEGQHDDILDSMDICARVIRDGGGGVPDLVYINF